jgi:hypothetical protein
MIARDSPYSRSHFMQLLFRAKVFINLSSLRDYEDPNESVFHLVYFAPISFTLEN